MNIGIDAKSLSKVHTGIAVYVESVVDWFEKIAPENNYFLFSNRDFKLKESWTSCKKIIYKTKITGSLSICFDFEKYIKKYQIDIFWGPEHCIPLNHSKAKKIVTIHDVAILINRKWGTTYNNILQRFMIKNSLKSADSVVAISNSTKNDLIKMFKIDQKKINVIYDGDSPYHYKKRSFNQDLKNEIRRKYNVYKDFFVYCGTIEPRKNIPTIIKAFDCYQSRFDEDTQLVICGGLGWKYKSILNCIQSSPNKDKIVLTGFVSEEEKEFFYKFAIATLFPSYYEGFGFPIVESMSLGTPVITARNSSLPEVGGDVAFYIDDANDFDQLCELMHAIQIMPNNKREKLSEDCIAQSMIFSRKECAIELLKTFNNVVNNAE